MIASGSSVAPDHRWWSKVNLNDEDDDKEKGIITPDLVKFIEDIYLYLLFINMTLHSAEPRIKL